MAVFGRRKRSWLAAAALAAILASAQCGAGQQGGQAGGGQKAQEGKAGQGQTAQGQIMEGKAMKVREAAMAGSWYPGETETLRAQVRGYLERAEPAGIPGRLLAVVVPHAGIMYSGQVAAYSYRQLEGRKIDLVVMIGPSHHAYLSGCSVWAPGAWRTPLGLVKVDDDVAAALTKQSPLIIKAAPETHAAEHSLEIQLPFIQEVCAGAHIVPIMMGSQDLASCRELARAVAAVLKGYSGSYVILASSDLSHFHPYDTAVKLDRVVLGHIEKMDAEGLAADLDSGRAEACGGGPVVAAMLAARELGGTCAKVLRYANSGDITGDRSGVVGYAAAVVFAQGSDKGTGKGRGEGANPGKGEAAKPAVRPGEDGVTGRVLSEAERKLLHEVALKAVECAARGERPPEVRAAQAALMESCGAFVTLKCSGRLRGCIGNIIGSGPLCQTVSRMAVEAATGDPRFQPLAPEEVKGLSIEISVLTPLELVRDPKEIIIGKHGLYIVHGMHRGLLLPQVATEQGWDRETFLEQTCWKAGLPKGAWKEPGAQIFRFGAEVF